MLFSYATRWWQGHRVGPRYAILIGAVTVALTDARAEAHGISVPWLDRAASDEKGIFLSLDGPTRVRKLGPITFHVTVLNAWGHADYQLVALEILDPSSNVYAGFEASVILEAERERVAALRALLPSPASTMLRDPEHFSLAQSITEHAVHWRARLEEPDVRLVFGRSDTTTLRARAPVLVDGRLHITEDALVLSKLSPLPDGSRIAPAWRWNPAGQVLEPISQPATARLSPMYWRAGDQHVHTEHSVDTDIFETLRPGVSPDSVTEFGDAAKVLGLDWIICTDHSNVHGWWGLKEYYTLTQYLQGVVDAAAYSSSHSDFTLLYAQEMGVEVDPFDPVPGHVLAYP